MQEAVGFGGGYKDVDADFSSLSQCFGSGDGNISQVIREAQVLEYRFILTLLMMLIATI